MGFFNYIESLFLLSLGITFVLILFLMYHFRQRIIQVEHKSEAMFSLVNNIVTELGNIRRQQTSNGWENNVSNPMPFSYTIYQRHNDNNDILEVEELEEEEDEEEEEEEEHKLDVEMVEVNDTQVDDTPDNIEIIEFDIEPLAEKKHEELKIEEPEPEPEPEPEQKTEDYSKLSLPELKKIVSTRYPNYPAIHKYKKAELIELLNKNS
jgi:stringent starvation protein B